MKETPLACLERLISSLATLVAEEAALLEAAAWEEAADVQQRIRVVADEVTRLARELGQQGLLPEKVRTRAEAIMVRQQATLLALQKNFARMQNELRALDSTRGRLNVVRPAYVGKTRLQATGAFSDHG
ncbi:MAG: hypothetical protein HZA31_07575 [Opitutae bacterium]|nr:hypothetical protein [Opitutae bacterium]